MAKGQDLGTSNCRWNLKAFFYGSPADPQIDEDFETLSRLATELETDHRGRVKESLGDVLRLLTKILSYKDKIETYLSLLTALDTKDSAAKAKMAEMKTKLNKVMAEKLTFADLEMSDLTEDDILQLAEEDEDVRHHLPTLRKAIAEKPHLLSEQVEAALAMRAGFGVNSWAEHHELYESILKIPWEGGFATTEELCHVLSSETDPERRAAAQKAMNDALGGDFGEFAAQALHVLAGSREIDDLDRRYVHPMQRRNLDNGIPDAVVEALHEAGATVGAELCQRFYRLKAALLELPLPLRWSDRNAPIKALGKSEPITFARGLQLVIDADRAFYPPLAEMIERAVAEGRLDVHVTPNRAPGAFNSTTVLPDGRVASVTFVNYLGSQRDPVTVAHEEGHMWQGELAGVAQGTLQFSPPMGVAEIASILNERVIFEHMLEEARQTSDEDTLRLIISEANSIINLVQRQLSFSDFERYLHGHDGATLTRLPYERHSLEENTAAFLAATAKYYGPDGAVLSFTDSGNTWAMISHFFDPMYVYAYSSSKLVVGPIFDKKRELGDDFIPRLVELVTASGTKNMVDLLAPFGLNPADPEFWKDSLRSGLGRLVEEGEQLARRLGFVLA